MITPHFGQTEEYAHETPIVSLYGNNFGAQIHFDQLKYPEHAEGLVKQPYQAVNEAKIEHLLPPGELQVTNTLSLHRRSSF